MAVCPIAVRIWSSVWDFCGYFKQGEQVLAFVGGGGGEQVAAHELFAFKHYW